MNWARAGWLLAAGLALLHIWMLHRYVVNFPLQDDFSQFLTVPGDLANAKTFGEKIGYLISSSGDHRVVTLRLAALFQAKVLGEINFRTLAFWGNLLCATAGLLVLFTAKARFHPWLAPLIAALLFSPSNWLPQYWASASLQHYSMLAYAFGSIFCLSRPGISWEAGGLFLGLCATMTGANGLMVLPIDAALLYTLGRRRASALWIVLTVVVITLYFIDYHPPPGRAPPLESLQHPLRILVFSLSTLGSLAERFEGAVTIGAVLVIIWVWLVATGGTRSIPPTLFAWMCFLLLCVGTIGFGRAPFGNDAMLNSRYHVYSEMAAIVTLIAVLWRVRPWQGNLLLIILLPVTAIWFAWTWGRNLPALGDLVTQQRTSLAHYMITGHGIYRGYPPQEPTDNLLKRAYEDGYFRPRNPSDASAILTEYDSVPLRTGSLGLWSDTPIVDATTITVRGFVPVNDRHLVLWLKGNNHLFRGALRTQRIFNLVGADWIIFWNTLLFHNVAPGRYRTGYSSDDADPPVVTWTDNWVDINK